MDSKGRVRLKESCARFFFCLALKETFVCSLHSPEWSEDVK